jgi:inward rectifier potassium channel
VGYGAISPVGHAASALAAFEVIFGWLSFAIITGILYGRFSRPSARIKYSKNAIVAPYGQQSSLQFRVANMRNSNLMEMNVTVLLMMVEKSGKGVLKRTFNQLELERDQILFFPLNWTIVHPITEKSPLYGLTSEDAIAMDAEILIMLKGFDDTFSQVVHSAYSYKADEIKWGVKFTTAFNTQDNGEIHLYFDKLDSTEGSEP